MASEPGSAAEAIRASVRALPAEVRGRWVVSPMTSEFIGCVQADSGKWICETPWVAGDEHVALLASPNVALALAELLEASHALEALDPDDGDREAEWDLKAEWSMRLRALEAAISGSGT